MIKLGKKEMDLDIIIDIVKKALSEERFAHSYEVMQRCEELAKIHGMDVLTAKFVGIAHDIAKEIPNEEKFKYIAENNIEIDEIEGEVTGLLHGKIGADICKKEFGFTDEMARAIEIHTTGSDNMSLLDKVLFVADITAEGRDFHGLDDIIEASKIDINKAALYAVERKINYNIGRNKILHPNSLRAKEYLQSLIV